MSNWKPIAGAAGYFVSRFGDVYSAKSGRELKQTPDRDDYLQVSIPKTVRVHRLVAEAFIGPCPEGYVVRHRDAVRSNNAAHNLRFGTVADNVDDRERDKAEWVEELLSEFFGN